MKPLNVEYLHCEETMIVIYYEDDSLQATATFTMYLN